MRPGPPRGDSTSVELTVTDELAALVAPGVPAVCRTSALLDAVEAACHQLIDRHLEAGEVATTVRVDLATRGPLPVGTRAVVTATVALVTPTSVTFEVMARHGGNRVAHGSLEQRVVDGAVLASEIVGQQPATSS